MLQSSAVAHDFFGQNPPSEKTAVLIANEAQAFEIRERSRRKPIRLLNNADVQTFVAGIRNRNRSHLLATTLDAITNGLIQNQLPPTGEHAPVVPLFSRSGDPFHGFQNSYIEIRQNKVEAQTLANLQSQFRPASNDLRPKIVFVVEDRQKALDIFSKMNSASCLFSPTPTGVSRFDLPDKAANEYERLYFTRYDNHQSAAIAVLPETDDMRIDFINRLMMLRSKKVTLDPSDLLPQFKSLSDYASGKLNRANNENRDFWATAWIHSLIERAYVQDYAQLEVQTALAMLKMIPVQGLSVHVLRFVNQVLGTSPDALAYLRNGKKMFEEIPGSAFDKKMYEPSYFGLLQNLHATELYQVQPADPGAAEATYRFVKDEGPYFTNLAMLGNTAALGHLTSGDPSRAFQLYEELKIENAGDTLDRWSILSNRLVSMYQAFGEVDDRSLLELTEIVLSAKVSNVWKYHLYRFALNLIGVDTHRSVSAELWLFIENSGYFSGLPRGDIMAHQKRLVSNDFSEHTKNGVLSGQMGDFLYKSGMFPSADFDWT
ncbi:hypothetical protein DFR52_1172 [Hoeflea marina]|uniref:Uncharacterized protein n=1 Tax=Hoeflea marina TaxID=274592 RepID=A0A317PC22_9HYPH|nr:hypothetical protein [Hoeflea marina]PWV94435.1 hypothetical protein DFR52_1172 [Hoeflea marina]